jgi:hypothetical protein
MSSAIIGFSRQNHFLLNLIIFLAVSVFWLEPGSSVSIESGYGLDDRAIEVRSPAEKKDFASSFCLQTGSGAHPASCTMGTGGPFPGAKARPKHDTDHAPPNSVEVKNM